MSLCTGLNTNPNTGKPCNPGYINGVILFEDKPTAISKATAALQATWDALFLQDKPNRGWFLKFKETTPSEIEVTTKTYTDGSTIKTNEIEAADMYAFPASECSMKSIYGGLKAGRALYAYYTTSNGYLEGKEVTADTIEAVEVYSYASFKKATGEQPKETVVYLQNLEKYQEYVTYVNPSFDVNTLKSVQNLIFKNAIVTTTSLQLDAFDCDGAEVTSLPLTAAYFLLTNVTDNTSVTVTNVTKSGNTYTLSFAAQTNSDDLSLTYAQPSVTNLKYENISPLTASVPAS